MITQETDTVFADGPLDRHAAVIVPLYNYEGYITGTLDSVAEQSCRDLLLVVVDDCSRDGSLAVAERWMRAHRGGDLSLLLLHNRVNARLAITRNTGIAAAAGADVCMFLDADNQLYPRCVEKHAAALAARPEAMAAHALIEMFGSERSIIGGNVHSRNRMRLGNTIDAMAMVRRSYLMACGGYRNIRHGWEDYDLWLRMCEADDLVVQIPEILSRYRVHAASMLRTETNEDRNIQELRRAITALHPWITLL